MGRKGVSRPLANPDQQVEVTADRCPDCGTELGYPIRIVSEIIEKIPKPQPIIITEFKIAHDRCHSCHKEFAASDADFPLNGRFGNNAIAQITLLKYEDLLPHRKIQNARKRMYGLNTPLQISPRWNSPLIGINWIKLTFRTLSSEISIFTAIDL